MDEGADIEAALADARRRLAEVEARLAPAHALDAEARVVLARILKRKKQAQLTGVRTWESAQRGALRMGVLALGCVLMGSGAWALDDALGGASLVVSLVVLGVEGLR
jgi:hypothetical protein